MLSLSLSLSLSLYIYIYIYIKLCLHESSDPGSTRIRLQCERPQPGLQLGLTHIYWWITTQFVTGSELNPG